MNPVFWFLILLSCVCLWFLLRNVFVLIGSATHNLLEDTKAILNDNGDEENANGGNENA